VVETQVKNLRSCRKYRYPHPPHDQNLALRAQTLMVDLGATAAVSNVPMVVNLGPVYILYIDESEKLFGCVVSRGSKYT
jgi:hypothetical protein